MQNAALRTSALLATAAISAALVTAPAHALQPDEAGWYKTGEGIRKKSVGPFKVDVYKIVHNTRKLPDQKTKQAMIALDADKRLDWIMMRDVEKAKITEALRDAYKMNGYTNQEKIGRFMSAFSGDLKKGQRVTIDYDSAAKKTTVNVAGAGKASIEGDDFMKGTWSIWFGKIDQPSLGDDLMKNM